MSGETKIAPVELKPCPFCGGKETHVITSDHWTGMRSVILSATIMHHCNHDRIKPLIQMKGKTIEEATDRWNNRIEAAPAPDNSAVHLPKITEDILSTLEGESFIDFGYEKDHKPEWSQAAVDFACLLNQHRHAAPAPDDECEWYTEDDCDSDEWFGSCGACWTFFEGGPNENAVEYCFKCGGKVRLKEQSDE